MKIDTHRRPSVERVKRENKMAGVVNVATVIHRSPFRYPGGKTWLVPRIRQWLKSLKPGPLELAEPFAGGAIVSLSALFDNLVSKIVLVERDVDVGAVWRVILNGRGGELANQIVGFNLIPETAKALLSAVPKDDFERAFATIVRNRIQRGGIIAPGASWLNKGENGRGILSRWYPETLKKRVDAIVGRRTDMTFIQGDGIEFIRYNAHRSDTAFFIDPPYTVAGRRLYAFSNLDHRKLFKVAACIKGDFLMTYDDAKEIRNLAKEYDFQTTLVPMKNTHHEIMFELLVGKNLDWVTASPGPSEAASESLPQTSDGARELPQQVQLPLPSAL
jgi:DNA adenine methylase